MDALLDQEIITPVLSRCHPVKLTQITLHTNIPPHLLVVCKALSRIRLISRTNGLSTHVPAVEGPRTDRLENDCVTFGDSCSTFPSHVSSYGRNTDRTGPITNRNTVVSPSPAVIEANSFVSIKPTSAPRGKYYSIPYLVSPRPR